MIVELDSTPTGATVRIGDAEYGPTPAQVELTGEQAEPGAELTFVFSADGHRDMTVTRNVPAEGSLDVSARLRRVPHRPAHRGGHRATHDAPREAVTPAGYRESPY